MYCDFIVIRVSFLVKIQTRFTVQFVSQRDRGDCCNISESSVFDMQIKFPFQSEYFFFTQMYVYIRGRSDIMDVIYYSKLIFPFTLNMFDKGHWSILIGGGLKRERRLLEL